MEERVHILSGLLPSTRDLRVDSLRVSIGSNIAVGTNCSQNKQQHMYPERHIQTNNDLFPCACHCILTRIPFLDHLDDPKLLCNQICTKLPLPYELLHLQNALINRRLDDFPPPNFSLRSTSRASYQGRTRLLLSSKNVRCFSFYARNSSACASDRRTSWCLGDLTTATCQPSACASVDHLHPEPCHPHVVSRKRDCWQH